MTHGSAKSVSRTRVGCATANPAVRSAEAMERRNVEAILASECLMLFRYLECKIRTRGSLRSFYNSQFKFEDRDLQLEMRPRIRPPELGTGSSPRQNDGCVLVFSICSFSILHPLSDRHQPLNRGWKMAFLFLHDRICFSDQHKISVPVKRNL